VLVELKLVEQRYRAVIDVLDGMRVTDVARRNQVSRRSVQTWLRRYFEGGMAALADKSSKPESCQHQIPPLIEARVVELRRAHPRWGPRSIRTQLANEGSSPLPGVFSIYRTVVRHHLLEPTRASALGPTMPERQNVQRHGSDAAPNVRRGACRVHQMSLQVVSPAMDQSRGEITSSSRAQPIGPHSRSRSGGPRSG
jgi:Homeodomain-like domain